MSIHHDEIPLEEDMGEELPRIMHFQFKNFDHFLRCVFGVERYDAEKEDQERVEEYKKGPHQIPKDVNVIFL